MRLVCLNHRKTRRLVHMTRTERRKTDDFSHDVSINHHKLRYFMRVLCLKHRKTRRLVHMTRVERRKTGNFSHAVSINHHKLRYFMRVVCVKHREMHQNRPDSVVGRWGV